MAERYDGDEDLIKIRKRRKKESGKRVKNKRAPDTGESRSRGASRRGARVTLEDSAPEYNKYYIAIADRYRWARYLTFIILVGFLLVMLIFFRENITYDNLMYLARDLDSDTAVSVGTYADITYDEQYTVDFAMFRTRIASAGTSGFDLYSSTGSREMEYDLSYGNPRLITGEKYALVYDAGGRAYSVYTPIARVNSAECDQVIEDAAIADDGTFALMTRSDDSRFLVTVYNPDFKAVTKYYKDSYVTDIALDADGKNIAAVSVGVNSSDVTCELMTGAVGSEETSSVKYENTMPVALRYNDDGSLCLVCDNSIKIFKDGELYSEYSFSGVSPTSFDVKNNIIAVCASENAIGSENQIFVFDTELNILYNIKISKKVDKVTTDGTDAVYAVCEGSIVRLSLGDGTQTEEKTDITVLDALPTSGGLVVCGPDGTKTIFAGS